jgi:multiple sugar transport system permease protein
MTDPATTGGRRPGQNLAAAPRTSRREAGARLGWQFAGPALAISFLLLVLPLAFSLYVSFHRWDLTIVPSVLRWVGAGNYAGLLHDRTAWQVLGFTFGYTAACVIGELVIGLGLALLVNRVVALRPVFISLLILPMMMAPIVTGLAWRLLLNAEYGPVNALLGLRGTLWLGDITLARISVIVATIWQETPFVMVMLLAGLRSLPLAPFEAAMIDGASPWQTLLRITLPLLRPVIVVVMLIRTILEFRAFDIIWILTTGGPGGGTETLSLMDFRISFRNFAIGPGAALSWVMFALTSVAVVFYLGAARSRDDTQGAAA